MSIGKRKRGFHDGSNAGSEDESIMRARFQKAFEAKFKPLPQAELQAEAEEQTGSGPESIDSEDEDEWGGLSDGEDVVQVISHAQPHGDSQGDEAYERRIFMSSKPPTTSQKSKKPTQPNIDDGEEASTEKANLKNDLALQRLLKESHLLDPSKFNGKVATVDGKSRLKSLDLRVQDLGAKKPISEQQKMPLSHRKGISAKVAGREDKRRKEAAENGIVLERAKLAAKSAKRRERSVGGPNVGKFKDGTLKLSSRDVRSIQGPKQRDQSQRKGRR